MLNTCYNSLSTCYLCHSFYTCLLSDSWVEEGEEGMLTIRLKADAGLWCLCCASPTHEQQHRNCQHPGSALTPLSYFFLYADLRDTEHSQLRKNTLLACPKRQKFSWSYSPLLSPLLQLSKTLWTTASEGLPKWNNAMLTLILAKRPHLCSFQYLPWGSS